MTAATVRLGRRRPVPLAGAGRLLRIEVRRNGMRVLVPLLAALVWFDAYRTAMDLAPVWNLRESVLTNQLLQDWEALVAGVGAWVGSREGRRHMADLVTPTTRPAWARRVLALAATVGWVLAAYLAFVGVLFGVTAGQATWGGPDWWPVTVGAAALTCVCGIGFAAGVFAPGRFTAPLAAIGMFMLSLVAARGTGFRTGNPIATLHRQPLTPALNGSGDALLSPSGGTPSIRIGVYYPYLPDLAIAQLLLLAGLTVAVLGVLGLRRGPGARAAPRAMVALVLTTPPGVAYSVSGSQGTPAQQAVALALLQDSGVQVPPGCSYGEAFCAPAPGAAQYLAFRRFAALPAATRHAWLAANLTALRAGRVTLEQLP